MTLQGQIALVTGASRGIGQAIALELGKQGATVIGTATSDKGAQAISAYLDAAGIKGAGMALNVNDLAQTEQVLGELRKQFGEISILVNNAGITRDNLLARMTDEEWDDVLATNLKSVFRLSRAVLRAMMKNIQNRRLARVVARERNRPARQPVTRAERQTRNFSAPVVPKSLTAELELELDVKVKSARPVVVPKKKKAAKAEKPAFKPKKKKAAKAEKPKAKAKAAPPTGRAKARPKPARHSAKQRAKKRAARR